jgi:hypothetical protein
MICSVYDHVEYNCAVGSQSFGITLRVFTCIRSPGIYRCCRILAGKAGSATMGGTLPSQEPTIVLDGVRLWIVSPGYSCDKMVSWAKEVPWIRDGLFSVSFVILHEFCRPWSGDKLPTQGGDDDARMTLPRCPA